MELRDEITKTGLEYQGFTKPTWGWFYKALTILKLNSYCPTGINHEPPIPRLLLNTVRETLESMTKGQISNACSSMTGTRTCSSPTGRNPPHEIGIWCHPVYAVHIPCLPCEETQPPPFHLSEHLHNIHHQLHACDPSGPANCLMEEVLNSENTKHKRSYKKMVLVV